MAQFVFAYHGGNPPSSPEEGQKMMNEWHAWMQGLGEAMVNPGAAVGKSKTAAPDGIHDNGGSNPLMGYSVVEAADIDTALAMAAACPHISLVGGSIEVAPVMDMEM